MQSKRFWEIDALRGIAVILMVFFHALFDLRFFAGVSLGFSTEFWFWFPRATASIFILLAGVSLSISSSRASHLPKKAMRKKFLWRGLKIFSYGLAITAFTFFFSPQEFIAFGILHFIGLSIILSIPFQRLKSENIALAFVSVALGFFLSGMHAGTGFLLWLGITPLGFTTFDFFPLFPWFGLILFGIALGNWLYPNAARAISLPDHSKNPLIGAFSFIGRNSLKIYFLHQPILIALIIFLLP